MTEVALSGILNVRFMGTWVPFSLLFQSPSVSIPVVHILFQETPCGANHMQESLFQSFLFIREILLQGPGIREKTPGSQDHHTCADLPQHPDWPSSFFSPIHHSFHFTNKNRISNLSALQKWGITFLINAM